MKHSILSISILLIFFAHTVESQLRPMTVDDGLNMVQLRGAKIAPNGSNIVFTKSTLDWKKNKRKSTHHHILPDGSDEYKFLGGENDSDIRFSPDGKYISFKRSVDKKSQIHFMRVHGGEAQQLTKHENSVSNYRWAPDSKSIYFTANEVLSKDAQKEKKDGYDHVLVDEGPNGQRKAEWTHLFHIALDSMKEESLLKKDLRINQFEIRPNGAQIAYTSRKENRRNQLNQSEIFLFNIADSTITQLTDNAAPEGSIQWSPDGKLISFMAADNQNWELKNSKLWLLDVTTKKIRLASGEFQGNIRGYYWSKNGDRIYFNGLHKTDTNIYDLNIQSGLVRNLSNRVGTWRILDMNKDRSICVLSFSDFDTPTDLFYTELASFNPVKLSNLNPTIEKDLQLAEMEVVQWKSSDGLDVEGLAYLPAGFKADATDPFLLHIHGGPAGVFTNSFNYRYHVWAGLGYVQLAPNVRGSSGYSDDLLRGNMNDIGGGDYEDLMSGVDFLLDKKYMDPSKLAVRGWSYGGILGGTTVTKTSRFKSASLGAMVSDWTSEYGIGFNYDVRLWYIGGTPWENAEDYRDKSALTHIKKVNTPVLLMHGEKDFTDTEAQSMMFFAALKDQGKEVKYIKFPREPHGFREPRHIRTRDIEEIKWVQKYTIGKEWTPWEREEDKKKDKKEVDKT